MFERFTEAARRGIYFGRMAASDSCNAYIEPEHLLWAMLKDSGAALESHLSAERRSALRDEIAGKWKKNKAGTPPAVDLPLSKASQLVLAHGAEEADRLGQAHIGPEHLLLGIFRLEGCDSGRILHKYGLEYATIRERILHASTDSGVWPALSRLAALIEKADRELRDIRERDSSLPCLTGGWSARQVLGHIIDSASNHHQRFVRALIAGEVAFPKYEQDSWVQAQLYQQRSWRELFNLWLAYNRHLLHVLAHTPEQKLDAACKIGDAEPMTLRDLVTSYMDHLQHHLNQIAPLAARRAC